MRAFASQCQMLHLCSGEAIGMKISDGGDPICDISPRFVLPLGIRKLQHYHIDHLCSTKQRESP